MKKLYYNGNIITVNESQPYADALLIANGKIQAVGTLEDISAWVDEETQKCDLMGKTLLPGFIDGHGHICQPSGVASLLYPPPIGEVDSIEKLLSVISDAISKKEILDNGWYVGIGYDNFLFEGNRHPTRDELDSISTEIPICIFHISGHIGVANSKALELAGFNNNSQAPEGCILYRDENGRLTGVMEEATVQRVMRPRAIKGLTKESLKKSFINSQKLYASFGFTTVQEGRTSEWMVDLLESLKDDIMLDIMVYPYIGKMHEGKRLTTCSVGSQIENHIKFAGVKLVLDGSPQGKTAWLSEPYYQVPESKSSDYQGYPVYTDEEVFNFCKRAVENNWQMLVHCNGDSAGDQFLNAYEKVLKDNNENRTTLRPVMIHAQTVREDQLERMRELGMMVSFFNDHVYYWGDYHLASVLGPERGRRISPLRSAEKRGIIFTLHNDMPVTPPNAIFNIHNAVNRRTRGGKMCGPEYSVDVMEAIRAVTIYGAYQYFDENIKGSIEIGKYADLVILNKNPLEVDAQDIQNIQVVETIKEGKTIYKRAQ